MTPLATAAVLLAAVTHAGWNAIAHRITDKLTGFALISGGGMLIGPALVALFSEERFGAPRNAAAGLLVVGIGLMLHTG